MHVGLSEQVRHVLANSPAGKCQEKSSVQLKSVSLMDVCKRLAFVLIKVRLN